MVLKGKYKIAVSIILIIKKPVMLPLIFTKLLNLFYEKNDNHKHAICVMLYACNNENSSKPASSGSVVQDPEEDAEILPNPGGLDVAKYDPNRGSGKFTTVDVANKLNVAFANDGQKVYDVKCSGCHKLTDEKLIGPGWLGVTVRHKPEWIMNFVTNTDEMLKKIQRRRNNFKFAWCVCPIKILLIKTPGIFWNI